MRICLQILYTKDWYEVANLIVPNVISYCEKHNYLWAIQCINEPYNGFEKLREIKKIFEYDEADVVVSLDCDTVITNHSFKIEYILDDRNVLFISKDYFNINAGVFAVRNIEGTNKVLDAILGMENDDKDYCEQNAIIDYMEWMQHSSRVKVIPQHYINSYMYSEYPEVPIRTHEQGNWEYGDFLLHLPGMTLGKRIEIINRIKPFIKHD